MSFSLNFICRWTDRNVAFITQANEELQQGTGGSIVSAATQLDYIRNAEVRARTLNALLNTCRKVAVLIERGRKQASLNRPKAALDAVQEARLYLSDSLGSIMIAPGGLALLTAERDSLIDAVSDSAESSSSENTLSNEQGKEPQTVKANNSGTNPTTTLNRKDQIKVTANPVITLEQTPFGLYAMQLLPQIENDILQAARRGLSKWFLAIRSNGDGLKIGRSILRRCATSLALGTGQVGHGGKALSYYWRAKTADNLIARASQSLRLSRSIRMGYWIDRDCKMECEILESTCPMGIDRKAEALACAFGWYRCWANVSISDIEVTKSIVLDSVTDSTNRSQNVISQGSRHGSFSFRSSSMSRVSGTKDQGINKARGADVGVNRLWASVLVPSLFSDDKVTRDDDDKMLASLAESLHPVHLAESAYAHAGKSEEFRFYYEQNRFGDVKIFEGKKGDDGLEKETRSPLSSLSGDDVTQGTDRVFFDNNLPRFCSHIVGFSAVEATLELGKLHSFNSTENMDSNDVDTAEKTFVGGTYSFREQSARYERNLIGELGNIYRSRAIGATLAELVRASAIISIFRSSLGTVHPGSLTRKLDKDLLRADIDILMTALKACQNEQLKETIRLSKEDTREPMRVSVNHSQPRVKDLPSSIPTEEVLNFPFGLSTMIIPSIQDSGKDIEKIELQSGIQGSRHVQTIPQTITYTFSQSIPKIVRLIHSRVISFAAFVLSQDELGSIPSHNTIPGVAVYVMDCLEECVKVAAIGMKEGSDSALNELSITTMIQISVNLSALQSCLPRLFGTITRGLCHIGVIHAENVNSAFEYANSSLEKAYKACDKEVGGLYSLVSESLRNKIDAMLKFALDKFQWVTKAARTIPNTYCDGLVEYLKSTFRFLTAMNEGSSAGLHFLSLGHIADRLTYLVAASSDSAVPTTDEGEFLPTISKIDAYGIKNLLLDVGEFQAFADNTKVPQLSECFNELKSLLEALLDPELPQLLQPQNEAMRKSKYPLLSLEKLLNVLEKYQVTTMLDKLMISADSEILLLEKKDIAALIKLIKTQIDKK